MSNYKDNRSDCNGGEPGQIADLSRPCREEVISPESLHLLRAEEALVASLVIEDGSIVSRYRTIADTAGVDQVDTTESVPDDSSWAHDFEPPDELELETSLVSHEDDSSWAHDIEPPEFLQIHMEIQENKSKTKEASSTCTGSGRDVDFESDLSDSYRSDSEPAVANRAEETEQRVKKTLCVAIMTACGMVLCIQLISRILSKIREYRTNDLEAHQAVEDAADHSSNFLYIEQQAPNAAATAVQTTSQQMATAAAQAATSSTAAGLSTKASVGATMAVSTGVMAQATAAVAGASMTTQVAASLGIAAVIATGAISASAFNQAAARSSSTFGFKTSNATAAPRVPSEPFPPLDSGTLPGTGLPGNVFGPAALAAALKELLGDSNASSLSTGKNRTEVPTEYNGTWMTSNTETEQDGIYCQATADLVEWKEGLVDLVIEGLPFNFTTQRQGELEEIFKLVYNDLSGMCSGYYQRVLQNVRLQEVNYVSAGENLLFTYTQWVVQVTCLGCSDDNPIFGVPEQVDRALNTFPTEGSGIPRLSDPFSFFTDFVEDFMFEIGYILALQVEQNEVRLFSGAVLNPIRPQEIMVEYTGRGSPVTTKPSDSSTNAPMSMRPGIIQTTGEPISTPSFYSPKPTLSPYSVHDTHETDDPTTVWPTTVLPSSSPSIVSSSTIQNPFQSPSVTGTPTFPRPKNSFSPSSTPLIQISATKRPVTTNPAAPKWDVNPDAERPTVFLPKDSTTTGVPITERMPTVSPQVPTDRTEPTSGGTSADSTAAGTTNEGSPVTATKTEQPILLQSKSPTRRPTDPPTTQTPTTLNPTTPTHSPSASPTTGSPTTSPTSSPTLSPTELPTNAPTTPPTVSPTISPTNPPTQPPTNAPTQPPTQEPTKTPTTPPTTPPTTNSPTVTTGNPSAAPTTASPTTSSPTLPPTPIPTSQPTARPTNQPTPAPTGQPTNQPSLSTSVVPSASPTPIPNTGSPTVAPTCGFTAVTATYYMGFTSDISELGEDFLSSNFARAYDFVADATCSAVVTNVTIQERFAMGNHQILQVSVTTDQTSTNPFLGNALDKRDFLTAFSGLTDTSPVYIRETRPTEQPTLSPTEPTTEVPTEPPAISPSNSPPTTSRPTTISPTLTTANQANFPQCIKRRMPLQLVQWSHQLSQPQELHPCILPLNHSHLHRQ
ncbi:laminin G sub domain 2 [Seminavis robusta]|uniref:Laminin G sub domain 2 n=1 Tax=Seminavis robusta TaxID=568900 RepID=A0A9N8DHC4_9STRA|nr:laminin G sub domain 2 [Seminavis robusta]|eukprot:Sro145_g067350.1 laminin G sub domain 2 (1175) ;mRNA; r:68112-71963